MPERHALLTKKVYQVVDSVLDQIQHTPNGYTWWHKLPDSGKSNKSAVRKHMAETILNELLTPDVLTMLVQASILPNGKPNDPLYTWVSTYIYAGNTDIHYRVWSQLKEGK